MPTLDYRGHRRMCTICGLRLVRYGDYCSPCFDGENVSDDELRAAVDIFALIAVGDE